MDKDVPENKYEVYMPVRLPYELKRFSEGKKEKESGIKTDYIQYSEFSFV